MSSTREKKQQQYQQEQEDWRRRGRFWLWTTASAVGGGATAVAAFQRHTKNTKDTKDTRSEPDLEARMRNKPKGCVRVVTFNVLAPNYTNWNTPDGKNESICTSAIRQNRITRAIKDMQPDICCLQEVTDDWKEAWRTGLQPDDDREDVEYVRSYYQHVRDTYDMVFAKRKLAVPGKPPLAGKTSAPPDGVLTLYRKDRYILIASEEVDFQEALKPRTASVVLLRDKITERCVAVINVHLEGAPNEKKMRVAQTREALDCMNTMINKTLPEASQKTTHKLMMGDFNETEMTEIYQLGLASGLQGLSTSSPSSYFDIRPADSIGLMKTIDYIFTSATDVHGPSDTHLYPAVDRQLKGAPYTGTGWPSDHAAVMADIRVPQNDSAN